MDSSIALGSNSSYSASEDDGVFLEGTPNKQLDRNSVKGDGGNNDNEKKKERGNDNTDPPQTKLTIELQVSLNPKPNQQCVLTEAMDRWTLLLFFHVFVFSLEVGDIIYSSCKYRAG